MSGSPLYASKKGTPRPAETYRAARRNAARGAVWAGVAPNLRLRHPPVRPNRSVIFDAPKPVVQP
jgi:hypothetical protein